MSKRYHYCQNTYLLSLTMNMFYYYISSYLMNFIRIFPITTTIPTEVLQMNMIICGSMMRQHCQKLTAILIIILLRHPTMTLHHKSSLHMELSQYIPRNVWVRCRVHWVQGISWKTQDIRAWKYMDMFICTFPTGFSDSNEWVYV